jgi:hypothetical protein
VKKILFCIFSIITISSISAENIFSFNWNFGNLGMGINYSAENDDNIEITGSLINLSFEHRDLNIGLEFNPIKYSHFFKFQDEVETSNDGYFSFINVNLYWDLIYNKSVLLGPFVSFNYLIVNTLTGINLNEYIFSGGLRFSYSFNLYKNIFNKYNSNILNVEIGYRNIMGRNKFYFSVYADLILALIGIGSGVERKEGIY